MQKLKFLFSPAAMGVMLMILAAALAAATFIENDFGSLAAYASVYDKWWFELIFILLAANLIGQLVIYRMFRKEKITIALFHIAFLVMIAGAGITRYTGWEGSMHIREGQSANTCSSGKDFLGLKVKDRNGNIISEHRRPYSLSSASARGFKRKLTIDGNEYEARLNRVIPNAAETIADDPSGEPLVSLLVTRDMSARETIILRQGEMKEAMGVKIGFDPEADSDLRITFDTAGFLAVSVHEITIRGMMTGESETPAPGTPFTLKSMQVISLKDARIVVQNMTSSGITKPEAVDPEERQTGQNALIFNVLSASGSETATLWNSNSGLPATGSCTLDGTTFEFSFGSEQVKLPFSLRLDDFILERYPGSNSPSGYRSNVTLSDSRAGIEEPHSIFMNNILKYKGYRFYQSSYDSDEQGTILSVSHDPAGMLVTYTGYGLLFLFIILSLVIRTSQFRNIKAGTWSSWLRKAAAVAVLFVLLPFCNHVSGQKFVPGKESSAETGKILVQDQKGRTKPLSTLTSDILRKVSHESRLDGYTPMQVFLGLYLDFDRWKDVPMISVSGKDLQRKLGISGNKASFSDIVNLGTGGSYKLSREVNEAYGKAPGDRNKFDKEVMKVDERVNIVYMVYKGDFMKIFPLRDGTTRWGSANEALAHAAGREDSVYLQNILPLLSEALGADNVRQAAQIVESITGYQERFAGYELPAEARIKAEQLYYKAGIFEKLFPFYSLVGIIMLVSLITMVIGGMKKKNPVVQALSWLLFAGFILHTAGLGLRWYISGHSPMSNGYESLIFISWVTILAGLIFRRKSDFALAATGVLAGMTLLVAHLSFMDPEITNLVPVLKSYLLTLHVSVIISSYGFLGLGAILGMITMILLVLVNGRNRERISETIDELVVINFRTLTLGLYFLTIGTFLGAVWANESWGRYWGWDPKETWSLITIIVYTLVTHSRMIPGMKNIFTFNLLSLFGFSSVLMTYFGVNYYLSGLHSYAGGDPVPVPAFVYVAVIGLVGLCAAAYMKYRKFEKA
jgi:cytochrome c-type biogenesis protein CcsB